MVDELTDPRHVSDTREWLVEGFKAGIAELPDELVYDLLPAKAEEYGRRAARVAVAPLLWGRAVGERLDTAQAMEALGVTRQALSKRVAAGSLIGIPGRGTTYFPAWQFDFENREIRHAVRQVIAAFTEELGKADPYVIAAWATTAQFEDLDGLTPADWIQKGADLAQLISAAGRAAATLAR